MPMDLAVCWCTSLVNWYTLSKGWSHPRILQNNLKARWEERLQPNPIHPLVPYSNTKIATATSRGGGPLQRLPLDKGMFKIAAAGVHGSMLWNRVQEGCLGWASTAATFHHCCHLSRPTHSILPCSVSPHSSLSVSVDLFISSNMQGKVLASLSVLQKLCFYALPDSYSWTAVRQSTWQNVHSASI